MPGAASASSCRGDPPQLGFGLLVSSTCPVSVNAAYLSSAHCVPARIPSFVIATMPPLGLTISLRMIIFWYSSAHHLFWISYLSFRIVRFSLLSYLSFLSSRITVLRNRLAGSFAFSPLLLSKPSLYK